MTPLSEPERITVPEVELTLDELTELTRRRILDDLDTLEFTISEFRQRVEDGSSVGVALIATAGVMFLDDAMNKIWAHGDRLQQALPDDASD
jgi:hypothetical protein